jgi:hypothetical protein
MGSKVKLPEVSDTFENAHQVYKGDPRIDGPYLDDIMTAREEEYRNRRMKEEKAKHAALKTATGKQVRKKNPTLAEKTSVSAEELVDPDTGEVSRLGERILREASLHAQPDVVPKTELQPQSDPLTKVQRTLESQGLRPTEANEENAVDKAAPTSSDRNRYHKDFPAMEADGHEEATQSSGDRTLYSGKAEGPNVVEASRDDKRLKLDKPPTTETVESLGTSASDTGVPKEDAIKNKNLQKATGDLDQSKVGKKKATKAVAKKPAGSKPVSAKAKKTATPSAKEAQAKAAKSKK